MTITLNEEERYASTKTGLVGGSFHTEGRVRGGLSDSVQKLFNNKLYDAPIRIIAYLFDNEKATRGRLAETSGVEVGDVNVILDMADFYDFIREDNGFYYLNVDEIDVDKLIDFMQALNHELAYRKSPNVVIEKKIKEQPIENKKQKRRTSNHAGVGSSRPAGGGHGYRSNDWNDEIALQFYAELERLRNLRIEEGLDGVDRGALK